MQFEFGIGDIFDYIMRTGAVTGIQLLVLFVPGLVLITFLHVVARVILKRTSDIIGWQRYLVLFGWLGISTHEIGHLIFSFLSMHLVSDFKLFSRKPLFGRYHGWVSRANINSNLDNLKIGSFFVGIGPVIIGSVVIYFAGKFLLGAEVLASLQFPIIDNTNFTSFASVQALGKSIWDALILALAYLLKRENLSDWRFYIFLYIAFSIASSMILSWPDIWTTILGFATILIVLFLFNLFTLWSGQVIQDVVREIASAGSSFYGMLLFVLMMNCVIAAFVFIIHSIFTLIRKPGKKRKG